MNEHAKDHKKTLIFIILLISYVSVPFFIAIFSSPSISLTNLFHKSSNDHLIFFQFRLPRVLLALIVGSALSVSGLTFQSLLKNPLADPYILGVSGGSALGYICGIVFSVPVFILPFFGFLSALITLVFIFKLSQVSGTINTFNLLLTGIITNSFAFALILLINSLVQFGQSQQILFLLLGSIETISFPELALASLIVIVVCVLLFFKSNKLNILSLGDEEAYHLGLDINKEKKSLLIYTSLLVGVSVSLCGLIGFLGLFTPHIFRLILGSDHKKLVPACFIGGGIFLAIADFLARNLFMWQSFSTRVPVGVITTLIGAPLFVYLLRKANQKS